MRRRKFMGLVGGAAAWPLAAGAQPANMKRIAFVSVATKVADMGKVVLFRVFLEELSRHGFVEGQNLIVERYTGEGRIEHYAEVAREAISTHPDLIFVPSGIPMASEFKSMTTTIPIIMANTDPVATGLVSSLARPGGNITGASTDGGREFHQKRLEFLAQAIPKLSRVGYLSSQRQWEFSAGSAKVIREAAERAGISLIGVLLGASINEAAYRRAFNSIEHDQLDGLVISQEGEHLTHRATLVELAAKSRIPAIYPYRENCQGAWPRTPRNANRHRRRGDRMTADFCLWPETCQPRLACLLSGKDR